MSDAKRLISLKEFAQNLPPGAIVSPAVGRYVFGSRSVDTLPYLVQPGADAAVRPEDVINTPVTTTAHVFNFDLSKEEHLEQYQAVRNAIAAGWYKEGHIARNWDSDTKNMRIYIEVIARHRVIQRQTEYDAMLSQIQGLKPGPIQ